MKINEVGFKSWKLILFFNQSSNETKSKKYNLQQADQTVQNGKTKMRSQLEQRLLLECKSLSLSVSFN